VQTPLTFTVNDTRLLTWAAEADPWLHGYWQFDWADNHVSAQSFKAAGDGINVIVGINPKTPTL
jgi:hypothetical protein